MCDPANLVATLRKYVVDHSCQDALGDTDRSLWTINDRERVVFRGQEEGALQSDYPFFSTTTSKEVARGFSKDGVVYEVRILPGVRILDVNAVLGDTTMSEEREIIVDGGGLITQCQKIDGRNWRLTYGPGTPETRAAMEKRVKYMKALRAAQARRNAMLGVGRHRKTRRKNGSARRRKTRK